MYKTNKSDHSDECDDDESTESDTSIVNNEGEYGNVDIENFYDVFGDWTNILQRIHLFG